MPGGSKKGERRGGAKPGRIQKDKIPRVAGTIKRGGRPPGSGNKSKFDPALGVILNKRQDPLKKEQELEMYFLAVGRRMRMPREVMLDAMRYLEETGIQWAETVKENMKLLAACKDQKEREPFEQAITFAETRVREYILLAVDVAYKAAPYCHARLAALITNPQDDRNPLNAVAMLFKELDEAGRPATYIDYDPAE
jgi:hypothetical protein